CREYQREGLPSAISSCPPDSDEGFDHDGDGVGALPVIRSDTPSDGGKWCLNRETRQGGCQVTLCHSRAAWGAILPTPTRPKSAPIARYGAPVSAFVGLVGRVVRG